MKEFFLTLTGAICSVIGGCIAIWYQAKKSRQIRMEEVKGEQLLEACKKALFLTGRIQTLSDSVATHIFRKLAVSETPSSSGKGQRQFAAKNTRWDKARQLDKQCIKH